MSLVGPELEEFHNNFEQKVPSELKDPVNAARDEISSQFDPSKAIQVGDKLPEFTLKDIDEEEHSSSSWLAQGPLVITFYRGEWAPYCSIALSGFQRYLDQYKAKGVSLVAITPELPKHTRSITEKNGLQFTILTDLHNEYAHKLGIAWKQPDYLPPVLAKFDGDLKQHNGDDSYELPIASTFLVDKDGTIRNECFNADHVKRVEPRTVLEWIDSL